MTEPIYAIGLIQPTTSGDGLPAGLALTSIVGKAFSLDEMAAFVLDLHRCMAGGTVPLEHHWPPAGHGWEWKLVPIGGTPTTNAPPPAPAPWWASLTAPFKARAKHNCRVWRVFSAINYDAVITTTPAMTLTDRRIMDIFAVYNPGGGKPAWFTVWESGLQTMVCLAEETETT